MNQKTDNVTQLVPKLHYTFDIWETKDGYRAEAKVYGGPLWEYSSESLGKVTAMILTTIGRFDDNR